MKLVDLSGKRILITGASSGIGRACAITAARLGAFLVLTGRRKNALDETVKMCDGGGHVVYAGDITRPEFVKELVEAAGKIDGLVHAAGIAPMCPIGMFDADQFVAVMETNYAAFIELMKYYAKARYRTSRLNVVAISSVSALAGWAGGVAYCGSKGALSASVRALAMELASKGIRVNAVCPSNVRTPLYEAGAFDLNDEDALTGLLKKQPLGLAEAEQIAAPVCFLLSDAASFITGVNLPVDGGYLAH